MGDFENSLEIDIEDLEAHLYGQIYHSTLSEEIDMESKSNSRDYELNRLNNKKGNRYYENPDINVVPQPYQPNKFIGLNKNSNSVEETGGLSQDFYSYQNNLYTYQNHPNNDRYSNACQQIILPGSPAINNIVVIPPAPTQCFSTAFHPLFNKYNKKKRAKLRKKLMAENSTKKPFREHKKQNKTLTPVTEQTQPNKTIINDSNKLQDNSKDNGNVVVLSDSNDSDIEEVILETTVIDISSNDDENASEELGVKESTVKTTKNEEKSQKKEDDVIQVKDENQKIKKAKRNTNLETDNEDDVIVLAEEPVEHEIIEVEDTKDSYCSTDITLTIDEKSFTSKIVIEEADNSLADGTNDFLDSVQLSQHCFNFQLHGSDFYCSKSTTQLKNNVNNEAYETESSCSTVDIPIKSSTLNDISFETPGKEVFDEPNLESFANFITPKRKHDDISTPVSESSKPKRKKSKSPKTKPKGNEEFININDDEKKLRNKKKSKVSQDVNEQENKEKISKKKRKGKTKQHFDENRELLDIENLHDGSIIPLELSESGIPKPKKKKKRKIKKNTEKSPEELEKTLDNSISQDGDVEESSQTSVSSKKRKRKIKQVYKKSNSDIVKSDANQAREHSTVSVVFTNDSDSDDSIYTVDYEIDNNSNSNLSVYTIAETGMARDKQEDDDSFDDFRSISDTGEDVEIVNVDLGQKKHPLEKTRVHSERKQFSDFWDNDMKKFYTESWGHDNFSVSESQKCMSDDPNIWRILDQDRYLCLKPRGPRCRSCRQWGHLTYRCPNKSNFLVCTLCGGRGHMEPRCPNKICTSCGQQMNYFTTYCTKCKGFMNVTCNICNMKGHPTKMCPDLWRRYHLTTKEGPVVSPEREVAKPFHKRWCSGCGSQGHFEYDCKYYNRTHSATLLAIQSYDPVYKPVKKSPVKRKQENEDGVSKRKQLKTNNNNNNKSEEQQQEAAVKSRKKTRKQKATTKENKEQETIKLQDSINKETEGKSYEQENFDQQKETNSTGQCIKIENSESLEIKQHETGPTPKETETSKQVSNLEENETLKSFEENFKKSKEESQEEISIENKETCKFQEGNHLETSDEKEEIKHSKQEIKFEENSQEKEVPQTAEENQNEPVISKPNELIQHEEAISEGIIQEKSKCTEKVKKEEPQHSQDETLPNDNEITIVEEVSTLQGTLTDTEQQGTSKDQEEGSANQSKNTSNYHKKLEEFAKKVQEIYKTTQNPKPLTKNQRRKLAKSQNNPQQRAQFQPQQQPPKKNKRTIQPTSRPSSLFGDPLLLNPWGPYPVLNPKVFCPSRNAHFQNNFYNSPFQTNNYQLPFHANIQNLLSGSSLFSSSPFLNALMQANMGQGQQNMAQGLGLANMSHGLANMGQGQPNVGQGLANMEQCQLNVGQFQANVVGHGLTNMGQDQLNLGQCQSNMGQLQQNIVRQESQNKLQMYEINSQQQETMQNVDIIDLTESNGCVIDLEVEVNNSTNTCRGQKAQGVQRDEGNMRNSINNINTINLSQSSVENLNSVSLSAKENSLIKRAHGRFFMRDLSNTYGITYRQEKKKIVIIGNVNENIMDMIKAEIKDFFQNNRQVTGLYPLPKNFSDAKQVVEEYFELMGPLDRLSFHFSQLVRMNRSGNKHPNFVRKMSYKIIQINRILIGKLLLKNGKKHLDILRNRFFRNSAEKEFRGQEWESLNESFNYVFQNDTDALLCIEFLSNLPTHLVPRILSDDMWKPLNGLKKEDRNSIHFILNDREACFCVKNLFHFLDTERQNCPKKLNKKQ